MDENNVIKKNIFPKIKTSIFCLLKICIKTHSPRYLNLFFPLTGNGVSGREEERKQMYFLTRSLRLFPILLQHASWPFGFRGHCRYKANLQPPEATSLSENRLKSGKDREGGQLNRPEGGTGHAWGLGKNQFKCVNISGLTLLPGLKKPNQFHRHMKIQCSGHV